MLTYSEAAEMLSRSRTGRRKLENNTYLIECKPEDGNVLPVYAIRLHGTNVVTIQTDGRYTLDSGGWRTVTTKDRINRYGPGGVWSDRGTWYWSPTRGYNPEAKRYVFADGMTVRAGGQVTGAGLDTSAVRRMVLKQINAYVDGFAAHVAKHGLDAPGSGDCWGCCMRDANAKPGDRPPGKDEPMGVDHYFSHFAEGYYVPSLLWRAVQRCGNPEFCYHNDIQNAMAGRPELLVRDLKSHFRRIMPALVEYAAQMQAAGTVWNYEGDNDAATTEGGAL